MKNFNIHLISLLFVLLFCYADHRVFAIKANRSPDSPIKKEMVNEWIAASPVHFIENKGQMTDLNHIPALLYYASISITLE